MLDVTLSTAPCTVWDTIAEGIAVEARLETSEEVVTEQGIVKKMRKKNWEGGTIGNEGNTLACSVG